MWTTCSVLESLITVDVGIANAVTESDNKRGHSSLTPQSSNPCVLLLTRRFRTKSLIQYAYYFLEDSDSFSHGIAFELVFNQAFPMLYPTGSFWVVWYVISIVDPKVMGSYPQSHQDKAHSYSQPGISYFFEGDLSKTSLHLPH